MDTVILISLLDGRRRRTAPDQAHPRHSVLPAMEDLRPRFQFYPGPALDEGASQDAKGLALAERAVQAAEVFLNSTARVCRWRLGFLGKCERDVKMAAPEFPVILSNPRCTVSSRLGPGGRFDISWTAYTADFSVAPALLPCAAQPAWTGTDAGAQGDSERGSLIRSSRSAPAGSGCFWVPRPRSLRLADLLVQILAADPPRHPRFEPGGALCGAWPKSQPA
jgi:hypothetical protein